MLIASLTLFTTPALAPQIEQRDVASPDAIIKSLYDVISGPAGQRRNWDRMKALFHSGAKMIAVVKRQNGETAMVTMTADDYIKNSGPVIEERGFFEKETHRVLEEYGAIAHAFSTYESRSKLDDAKPFQRGINSVQLISDGKRWWISSLTWQAENSALPIPPRYLPNGG